MSGHDGRAAAAGDGHPQRVDRQVRGLPLIDGVAEIRWDHTSLTARRYSFPSAVWCSVMSVSYSWFGPTAVKSRSIRSSCTGGPGSPGLARYGRARTRSEPVSTAATPAARSRSLTGAAHQA